MDIENFSNKYGTAQHRGGFFTYEPKELPIDLNTLLDFEILNLIDETSFALGSLNNYVSKLENADLLLVPYLKKEALSSSTIEGTKTSLDQVFLSENEKSLETKDSKEVLNYSDALNYGLKTIQNKNIDETLIKSIHKILMRGVRGERKDPGSFKKVVNWIGGADANDAEFVPAHPDSINRLIKNLVQYINQEDRENVLFKTAILHYQFETIHPFRDGNGRIGRLLIILFLCKRKKIVKPLIYISEFFEKNKKEYMARLQQVREKGRLKEWIKFFLQALKEQAQKSITKIEKLTKYKTSIEKKIRKKKSLRTLTAIDYIFENPYLKITDIQKNLKVGYPTAKLIVNNLLQEKILVKQDTKKRNKKYLAKKVLEILAED